MKPLASTRSISLQGETGNCSRLLSEWEQFAEHVAVPGDISGEIKLVIEETFVNIASYAYSSQSDRPVTMELSHGFYSEEGLQYAIVTIIFSDDGRAFDPLNNSAAKPKADPSEGGMGIHLMRSLTDEQEYCRIDGRNVLTLRRSYTPLETESKAIE